MDPKVRLPTALSDAITEGSISTVEMLLAAGADPNSAASEDTPLYWAALLGHSEIVGILLAAGASVAPGTSTTAIHAAAEAGHLAALKLLLTASGKAALNRFDDFSRTPLMCAVQHGHLEAVRWLLQNGVGVNAQDEERSVNTALRDAAANGSFEMIDELVKAGADPSQPGWMQLTALHKASERTDPEAGRILELLRLAVKSRQ